MNSENVMESASKTKDSTHTKNHPTSNLTQNNCQQQRC